MSKYTTNRIRIDEVTSLDVISGRGNFTHVSGEQKKNELNNDAILLFLSGLKYAYIE